MRAPQESFKEKKKVDFFFPAIQWLWKPWLKKKKCIDMGIVEETVEPMFTSFLPEKLYIS